MKKRRHSVVYVPYINLDYSFYRDEQGYYLEREAGRVYIKSMTYAGIVGAIKTKVTPGLETLPVRCLADLRK